MSNSDRKPYLTASSLTQQLLDYCQDNLVCQLEMVVDIQTPTGTIYASDRNKYVGSTFYEALLNFPVIEKTVGDWLSNELEFSTLTLELSNADGRFNNFLPGGADFESWIGKSVEVKLGLSDIQASYFTIFKGNITSVGGLSRSTYSITLIARDKYDSLSVQFPTGVFSSTTYPYLEKEKEGTFVPIIYGDWTVNVSTNGASIPATCINGMDPFVDFTNERAFTITISSPAVVTLEEHNFILNDKIQLSTDGMLPTNVVAGVDYWVEPINSTTFYLLGSPSGSKVNSSGTQSGVHRVVASPTATVKNVKFVISQYVLSYFDTSNVFVKRNDKFYRFTASDITNVNADKNYFEVIQGASGATLIEGEHYSYQPGENLYVKVKGKDLGAYDDNIVWQARDILMTWAGLISSDFNSNWETYRDKNNVSYPQSAIANIKSRVWINEQQSVIQYVLSMLEQVRLEAFVDRNQKLKISSLHFEDFTASPTYLIRNFDVVQGSMLPRLDDRTNINRARGVYAYLPDAGTEGFVTPLYRNQASITQIGKDISKQFVFPNLYVNTDVQYQVIEMLRLASSFIEIIECDLTWRSILQDVGNMIKLNVNIGSLQYENIPCLIRKIGYDPQGIKLKVSMWSFQLCPFPGYSPGYSGIVGGYNATITQE